MQVNFGDSIPISTVDWHGRVSVVIFLRECPFRCPYCHNYEILSGSDHREVSEIKSMINSSKPFVSNVVFSGGEPLIQAEAVEQLATYAKANGLLVGMHTNGLHVEVVEDLVDRGIVDKFFIDVKAPLDDPQMYGKAIGYGESDAVHVLPEDVVGKVEQTIALLTDREVEYELRTTAIRDFIGDADDVAAIARSIADDVNTSGASYVIQQGIPEHAMKVSMRDIVPFTREELLGIAESAHQYVDNIWIRTKEGGNEKVNFE
ncbi:MAG: anaerobic ribonucleoside-triphosphate reductase activating protein [Methanosarcinaceae archaeon]|nr:anaerobic ribonucleoside-triphosphate reductase activating protein [Methanosarcinaceae archaeon]